MGRMPGYKQVSLYVEPIVYERTRCAAYALGEDIYEFVGKALDAAVDQRMKTKGQRAAVEQIAQENIKKTASRAKRG